MIYLIIRRKVNGINSNLTFAVELCGRYSIDQQGFTVNGRRRLPSLLGTSSFDQIRSLSPRRLTISFCFDWKWIVSARARRNLKMVTRYTNARDIHSCARELVNDFPVTIDINSSKENRPAATILKKQHGYSTRWGYCTDTILSASNIRRPSSVLHDMSKMGTHHSKYWTFVEAHPLTGRSRCTQRSRGWLCEYTVPLLQKIRSFYSVYQSWRPNVFHSLRSQAITYGAPKLDKARYPCAFLE